jgi:hypothetical protein
LDFDKSANPRVITDLAAVQVHEAVYDHVLAHLDVRGYT